MDSRALRTLVRQTIRTLQVKDGDVLLIKARTDALATRRDVHDFTNAVRRGGRPNCVVIALESFDELAVMDEEIMELHGWVRKQETVIVPPEETINRFVGELKDYIEKDDK